MRADKGERDVTGRGVESLDCGPGLAVSREGPGVDGATDPTRDSGVRGRSVTDGGIIDHPKSAVIIAVVHG